MKRAQNRPPIGGALEWGGNESITFTPFDNHVSNIISKTRISHFSDVKCLYLFIYLFIHLCSFTYLLVIFSRYHSIFLRS